MKGSLALATVQASRVAVTSASKKRTAWTWARATDFAIFLLVSSSPVNVCSGVQQHGEHLHVRPQRGLVKRGLLVVEVPLDYVLDFKISGG